MGNDPAASPSPGGCEDGPWADRTIRADRLKPPAHGARSTSAAGAPLKLVPSSEYVSWATIGSCGKRTYGRDRRRELFEIAEGFQNEKIHAAFFERFRLLSKKFPGIDPPALHVLAELAPSGPIEPAIRTSCLAASRAFARDFDATVIEFPRPGLQAETRSVCSGFAPNVLVSNDMSAGFEVGHMNAKNGLRARGIQFIHAALRPRVSWSSDPIAPSAIKHRIRATSAQILQSS